jgi:3-oxoadipate enol-lactonase
MWLGIHAGYRIDRLVLANTAARIGPADVWNTRIQKVRAGGMAAIAPAVVERWFTPAFIAQHADRVAPARAMLEQNPPEGYVAACAAVRDMDQRESIARITRRTLVIAGTHDVVTPPAEARFLVEHIAGARYVELPAGHLSNVEAPAEFAAALLDFLL